MVTMTMHVEDYFADALRAKAAEMGKSVNQVFKDVLAPFLGLVEYKKETNPWMKFCGCCPEIDREYWNEVLAEQDVIDEEKWK